MKSRLAKFAKLLIIPLLMFCVTCATVTPIAQVSASSNICNLNVPEDIKRASGCNGEGDKLPSTITNILYGIIGVSSFVAVVFVVVGGVQYMTSAGDTQKTEKGKRTIIYALIGMAVCVLAFAIVNFVITNVIKGA